MSLDYQATIDYLFSQLPVYQRSGSSAIKHDLHNIQSLTKSLGNPHFAYPCIHVAGTNGKGTTAHIIASILQSSGLKVGLYTSPHYIDFEERIKVNGSYITEDYVVSFVEKMKSYISEVRPSFFEITVAMAFSYFRDEEVDIAIIETGLGGRLDSTNIVDPIVSVITHISLDHQKILGEDVYSIAHEKAGIIKKHRPVVVGRYQASCDQVFMKESALCDAPLSFASIEWAAYTTSQTTSLIRRNGHKVIDLPPLDDSPFILENAITALETIHIYELVTESSISTTHLYNGIVHYRSTTNYMGRWQLFGDGPKLLVDSAHNVDALTKVFQFIRKSGYDRIHFVLGVVVDKDIQRMLRLLERNDILYFTQPSVIRGLPANDLQRIAEEGGVYGEVYTDVPLAITAALQCADSTDLIYVGGSSFVVADALAFLEVI